MAQSVDLKWYSNATAKCLNCNSEYILGAATETFTVEICSNCHPFYTGKDTVIDTAGRIEKFQARFKSSQASSSSKKKKVKTRRITQSFDEFAEENAPQTPLEENSNDKKESPEITTQKNEVIKESSSV